MSQKPFAFITCGAAALMVLADRFFHHRPFELMAAPMLAVAIMVVGSLLIAQGKDPIRPAHLAGRVLLEHKGTWLWMAWAVPLTLVSPRLGLPLLGFAVARFRGCSVPACLGMGLVCLMIVELFLVKFLGTRIPMFIPQVPS